MKEKNKSRIFWVSMYAWALLIAFLGAFCVGTYADANFAMKKQASVSEPYH